MNNTLKEIGQFSIMAFYGIKTVREIKGQLKKRFDKIEIKKDIQMGSEKHEKESSLAEVLKKVISIGVGAAFMTEDAVRNILSDLSLPKDILSGLIQNARGAKEEFSKNIREELKKHFSKIDPKTIIHELAENYDIDIHAKLKFQKKIPHEHSKGKKKKSSDTI
jgi:hypothetical protein